MFWLKDGDLNNKVFHASATCKNKVNSVLKLHRDDRTTVEDHARVKNVDVSYFQDLFTSNDGVYAPIIDTLPQCVTYVDNEELTTRMSFDVL